MKDMSTEMMEGTAGGGLLGGGGLGGFDLSQITNMFTGDQQNDPNQADSTSNQGEGNDLINSIKGLFGG